MTREEQKALRERKKELTALLRKKSIEHNLKFAHGFVYKFDKNFVYYMCINIAPFYREDIFISFFIKPWVLNDIYWEVRNFDMEEMRTQPQSFQIRGAFTIEDIFYESFRLPFDKDNFAKSVDEVLKILDQKIPGHQEHLRDVACLMNQEQYEVSDLVKAFICIYEKKYEQAQEFIMRLEKAGHRYRHSDLSGKSTGDYVIEYCKKAIR